jgi:hypothetical protein
MQCRAANVVIMRTEFLPQRRKGAKIFPGFSFAPLRLCAKTVLFLLIFTSVAKGQEPAETIRIDSDLVDLKVSVLGFSPNNPPPLLEPRDFLVLEDGVPQEITFFAAADTPFDLVLLLDLSGSN